MITNTRPQKKKGPHYILCGYVWIKWCSACETWLWEEEFSVSRRASDQKQVKCKQCDIKHKSKWRDENRERNAEYNAKWYENNAEYWKDYVSKWSKANKEKTRQYTRRRRALKLNAVGDFTAEEFKELCETYENTCLCCGRDDVPMTADHVIPLSKGGTNDIGNIQPLCLSCNCSKNTKTIDYRKKVAYE